MLTFTETTVLDAVGVDLQPAGDLDPALAFLRDLFGHAAFGYLVLAFKGADGAFRHESVPLDHPDRWRLARQHVAQYINDHDCYVATATYAEPRRKTLKGWTYRTRTLVGHCGWAFCDRDGHDLGPNVPRPTFVVETSEGRLQDWYRLDVAVSAEACEELNRRIAAANGCGMQAIAATQVLRLPGTPNRKPERCGEIVRVIEATDATFTPEDFAHLPLPTTPPRRKTVSTPATQVGATGNERTNRSVVVLPEDPEDGPAAEPCLVDAEGEALWARIAPALSLRMLALADGEAAPRADGTPYPSESERDMALMVAIVGTGLVGNEAIAAFMATTRGAMLAERKPAQLIARLDRLVLKAHAWADAHPYAPSPSTTPFVELPRSLVEDAPYLGANALAVAGAIASFAPNPYPAQGNIAAMLDLSARTVGEMVKSLRAAGHMRTKRRFDATSKYGFIGDDYVGFPRAVLRSDEPLGAHAVAVAMFLFTRSHAKNVALTEVAEQLGITARQARAATRMLVEANFADLQQEQYVARRLLLSPPCEVISSVVPGTLSEDDNDQIAT